MQGKNKEWLPGINVLRGIAVLLIMFHHLSGYFGVSTWMGYAGVSIFCVMSGFLEGYHYLGKKSDEFGFKLLKKKLAAFLPLHLLMFVPALGLLILELYKNPGEEILLTATKIVAGLFFLQAFVPIRQVYFGMNGVEWYLTVYLYFIFFLPHIIRWADKIKNKCMALLAVSGLQLVFALIFGNMPEDFSLWIIYVNPFVRIFDFMEGVLLAYIAVGFSLNHQKYVKGPNGKWRSTVIESVYFGFFAAAAALGTKLPRPISMVWIFTTLSLGLVYLFASNRGGVTRALSSGFGILEKIGGGGTELYLIHQILYSYIARINNYTFKVKHPWIEIAMVLIVFLCAFLYKHVNEIILGKRGTIRAH